MLNVLRKKGFAKKILWVIAVVIIISFGFMGTAYLIIGRQADAYAGRIFNKKISFEDFEANYGFLRTQAMMQYGEKFNQVEQYLDLTGQTWDRLILLHEAKKRKLEVQDTSVVQAIEQTPYFQRKGQFDSLLYNDVLRYAFRMGARQFEEGLRDTLKLQKLFQEETGSINVNEEEIREAFKQKNEKVQISYAYITPQQFIDPSRFSEEKAREYYNQNKLAFLTPLSIEVDYLSLPFPEKKAEEMSASPTADAASTPSEDDKLVQAVKDQAQAIFNELLETPQMEKVAQKHQLEVKSSGFFSKAQPNLSLGWPLEVLNHLFDVEENQIVGPFETAQGMLIARIRQKKEAYVPEFTEVQEKIKEAFLIDEAQKITGQKAEEYLTQIKAAWDKSLTKDFSEMVKSLGLEINQTPLFNRGQYLPQIGISVDFQEAAFKLKEKLPLSGVVAIPNGFAILHLDKYEPADSKLFENQKDELSEAVLMDRRGKAFNDYLTRIRQDARLVDLIPKRDNS